MRDFTKWLSRFRANIADYEYYVDHDKIYRNVNAIKIELNILNSLIGSKNIEDDFEKVVIKYPETLKCIPILLAVREREIYAIDGDGEFIYNFRNPNYSVEQYKTFMRKTGLFNLIEKHIISNLIDYVTGVETGLDTNSRKNRIGHTMENLVEAYIQKAGFVRDDTYFKEMKTFQIESKLGLNLSSLSNQGKTVKKFDFVIKGKKTIYGIETNFYSSKGGSKLNETARSYKNIAIESKALEGFAFVWFTDGRGWNSAKNNLRETFDVLEHIYNIDDMENGIMGRIFK